MQYVGNYVKNLQSLNLKLYTDWSKNDCLDSCMPNLYKNNLPEHGTPTFLKKLIENGIAPMLKGEI